MSFGVRHKVRARSADNEHYGTHVYTVYTGVCYRTTAARQC